jgi:hypothetical protein
LFELVVEEALGDGRVSARSGVGQVEDQGKVQRVRSDAQGLMQYAVTADVFEADAAPQQMPLEVIGPDRPDPQSGSLSDQNVPIGGVRPAGAALIGLVKDHVLWSMQGSRVGCQAPACQRPHSIRSGCDKAGRTECRAV